MSQPVSHKELLYRQCEKMIRQQTYYSRLARRWEKEANDIVTPPGRTAELRAKIEVIKHGINDLQFILDQTRRCLAPDEWDAIQATAQDNQVRRDEQRRAAALAVSESGGTNKDSNGP